MRAEIDGMDVIYRFYECENIYPFHADDDFFELLEDLDEKVCDQLAQGTAPNKLMAVGHTLYVGYDSEWVERDKHLHVLSYQFYLIGLGGELSVVFIANERLALRAMLKVVLKIAMRTGTVLHYPRNIILAGYFLRADLAMLSDFIDFKNDLSNVNGSVATANRPLPIEFEFDQYSLDKSISCGFYQEARSYSSKITFYDLPTHAPEKTALSDIGELLGIEKLTVPNIERMDELRDQQFDLFLEYGIRDAEIVVKYYLHVLNFSQRLLDSDSERGFISTTAASLAVKLCERTIVESGLDLHETFGLTRIESRVFDGERGRFVTKKTTVHTDARDYHEGFVSKCYHGGINICYYAGATEVDIFTDYDLSGAYTTGLTVIRPFDYDKSFLSKKVKDFLGDVMGFALVYFEFPAKTRYPFLPVTQAGRKSLDFPLKGKSYCTAPELALAYRLGAKITIEHGVIYPWKSDQRIFKPFVQKIRELRKQYKKGSFPEQYAKLIGNSLYGKTGQGVKAKNVFDTRTLQSVKVPETSVTNAAIVSYVTGFVRAVMSEIVCAIPDHRLILNCVTDGILTNAREDEIDLSGELCQRFQSLVGEGGKMFEVKHEVKQALSIKTRGVATLVHGDNPDVKCEVLAKGSVSPPPDCENVNQYIVDLYFNRVPEQKVMTRPFVSVKDQWVKALDVFRLARETTLNYEYDFKRRPVKRRMVNSHVAYETVPWNNIEEIEKVQDLLSTWKKKRCIKTLEDFDVWEDYYESHLQLDRVRGRYGRLPIQITEEGSIGLLKRLFLRAYNKRCWGMDRPLTNSKLAELMSRIGFTVTEHDAKNGNKGTVYDNLVPCTVLTKPLVKKLKKAIPELDISKIFID
jgi:hypothetical protein